MCPDDPVDDGEAEADTRLIALHPLRPAQEGLDVGRDELWVEPLAGVLHGEHDGRVLGPRGDLHRSTTGAVVDDPVVHQVGHQLEQQRR